MGKIEIEDRTNNNVDEDMVVEYITSDLLMILGTSAAQLGLTFREIVISLLATADITTFIGKKSGAIKEEELDDIKKKASEFSGKRIKSMETSKIFNTLVNLNGEKNKQS